MGIRGAGQGVLIVEVAGIVGKLFAGVLEGLIQRSSNNLQR